MTTYRRNALPGWIYLPISIGMIFIMLPFAAIMTRVNWSQFINLISSPSALIALRLSLKTATITTIICLFVGIPLGLLLARRDSWLVRIFRSIILLPLVLPPVVGGIALLYTFGRLGLVGRYLDGWGIHIAFSTTAVVLAQTFVSLPFLVISLEGTARTLGDKYERTAATLGASPQRVWWQITIPLLTPGALSGTVLAFARSLGEFGATLTFAGSKEGVTRTLPLAIYLQRVTDADGAVAMSLLLVVVAAIVVFGLGARRVVGGQ